MDLPSTIHYLGELLGKVISEQESPALFEIEERIRTDAKADRAGDAAAAILAISNHRELMDDDPIIQRSVHLRNPYIDPLNYLQVEMIRRLRALPDQESAQADALREVIAITINRIAAGLRNTG